MNIFYFVYGIIAAFIVMGIGVWISDYKELEDTVRNNHEEISKQYEVIRHLNSKICELEAEWAAEREEK